MFIHKHLGLTAVENQQLWDSGKGGKYFVLDKVHAEEQRANRMNMQEYVRAILVNLAAHDAHTFVQALFQIFKKSFFLVSEIGI